MRLLGRYGRWCARMWDSKLSPAEATGLLWVLVPACIGLLLMSSCLFESSIIKACKDACGDKGMDRVTTQECVCKK